MRLHIETCILCPHPSIHDIQVADGYRPERTRALSDGMCALVAACWHEDPVQRPGMAEVERRLAALLLEEEARGGGARGGGGGASPGCGCTIS